MNIKNSLFGGILAVSCLLVMLFCGTQEAMAQCTYNIYAQPGTQNGNYTQEYILTDLTGTIISITPDNGTNTTITTPANGSFIIYALNYDPANPPVPLPTVGGIVGDVGSTEVGCFNSDFLQECLLVYCICDGEEISVTSEPGTPNGAYTQVYVAIDESNNVVEVSSTGTFSSLVTAGPYTIYALNYDPNNPPSPLPLNIGDDFMSIGSITQGCYNVDDLFAEFVCVAINPSCDLVCPMVTPANAEVSTCDGDDSFDLSAEVATWQTGIVLSDPDATAGTLVLSGDPQTTTGFPTTPPTGTYGGDGCAIDIQVWYAAYECDLDGDGIADSYIDAGTFTLNIYAAPQAPTVATTQGEICSFALEGVCGDETIGSIDPVACGTDAVMTTVSVTTVNGCTTDFEVERPACDDCAATCTLVAELSTEAPVCDENGLLVYTVTVSGSQGNLSWDNIGAVSGNGDGTYSVTVASGSMLTVNFTDDIVADCLATVIIDTSDETCVVEPICNLVADLGTDAPICDANGMLTYTVTVSGTQGNLSWDNTGAVSGNGDGTYAVTVAPGTTLTVNFSDDIIADCLAAVMIDASDETCEVDECTLLAELSNEAPVCDENGLLAYIVTVSGSQGNLSWDNTSSISDNGDGTYTVTVTPGTTLTISFTDDFVSPCTVPVIIDASSEICEEPPSCTLEAIADLNGAVCADGTLIVPISVTGSQGNITINGIPQTQGDITFLMGVVPGELNTITISDPTAGNDCIKTLSFKVPDVDCTEPAPCTLNIGLTEGSLTCSEDGTLTVELVVSGANGDVLVNGNAIGGGNGTYPVEVDQDEINTLTVTDPNGFGQCVAIINVDARDIICEIPVCNLDASISGEEPICNGDGTVTISVNISGSQGNIYQDGVDTQRGNGTFFFTFDIGTANTITFADPAGGSNCIVDVTYESPVDICDPAPRVCELDVDIDETSITCINENSFSADIIVSGTDRDILINGDAQNDGAGTYNVIFNVGQLVIVNVVETGDDACSYQLQYDATNLDCANGGVECTLAATFDPNSFACVDDNSFTVAIDISGAAGEVSINGIIVGGNETQLVTLSTGENHNLLISDNGVADCELSLNIDATKLNCEDVEPGNPPNPTGSGNCDFAASLEAGNFSCIDNNSFSANITVTAATGNIAINGVDQGFGNGTHSVVVIGEMVNTITITDLGADNCSSTITYNASSLTCEGVPPGGEPTDTGDPICNLAMDINLDNANCIDDNSMMIELIISGASGNISINGEAQNAGDGSYAIQVNTGMINEIIITDAEGGDDCQLSMIFDASFYTCAGIIPGEPPTYNVCNNFSLGLLPGCNKVTGIHDVVVVINNGTAPYSVTGLGADPVTIEGNEFNLLLEDFDAYDITVTDVNGCAINLEGSFSDCVTLDVDLVDFSGEVLNTGNQLSWVVASETNTSHYVLQYSTDGTQFENLYLVPAIGVQAGVHTYEYLHKAAITGVNYYRLIEVTDTDQEFILGTVSLNRSEAITGIVNIYPIPVINWMQVDYVANQTTTIQVDIYDVKGRLLRQAAKEVIQGWNSLNVDISDFTAGVYLLTIEEEGNRYTYKFTKQ